MSAANTAAVEHEQQIAQLRTRWESLAGLATLATLYDGMEDLNGLLNGLEDEIASVRARGYRYGRGWEAQTETLQEQWPLQYDDAVRMLEEERGVLGRAADEVDDLLRRAQRNPALAQTADQRLGSLERRIREAKGRVAGSFDQTQRDVRTLRAELERVTFLLDSLESATFQLFPEENAIAAASAAWLAKGAEPIEGIIFLTDGRLLFEQRQEIVTKKFLFVTKKKELVQEFLWQAPVGGIEILASEDKKGFLKARQELLTLRLEGGDGPPEVTLNFMRAAEGQADNEEWVRLLRRVREGQFEAERSDAAEPGEEAAPAVVEAAPAGLPPTQCPNCGAQLPTVYKGMQQVTCEYCGTNVPLA